MNFSGAPFLRGLSTFLEIHVARLRQAWRDNDRGASAVELAVIAAVLIAISIALLAVIKTFVTTESSKIKAP
ncbi:MAG TPA: hypothetical protein VGS19_34860 [Streptosporangiaceae bacterium]|nr:hypothetical protein [Streptosporangiaceae bacterium]